MGIVNFYGIIMLLPKKYHCIIGLYDHSLHQTTLFVWTKHKLRKRLVFLLRNFFFEILISISYKVKIHMKLIKQVNIKWTLFSQP